MKTAHFVAAAAMLFAAAVSAAPGPDLSSPVPATVEPDTLPRPDLCHCWNHFAYQCMPTYRCHSEGYACAGPC
ncbi:hypothetical protein GQ42DRAFT_162804 [Ramicandelaber brevisporus]|nr:hypothetical protein GQ42DRAFT_162804 [Ramicandelaber brevisporus]